MNHLDTIDLGADGFSHAAAAASWISDAREATERSVAFWCLNNAAESRRSLAAERAAMRGAQ